MRLSLKPFFCRIKTKREYRASVKKLSDMMKDELLKRLAAALRTKPFAILAGHSGTGKSQMVRRLAYMTCADEGLMAEAKDKNAPGNFCMIQVRPNWHDSTDLLGYYSELGKKYRTTEFVTPDIRVDEDGEVEVDKRDIPELRVSPKYVELAKDKSQDEETRTFAAERVKRAREFREAVIKRQETMEKIAELAISGQSDFLKKGTAGLHKQTMSEIAKAAKCNVATVSRAAARKYVKTPRGTVPLRKFFALVDQGPIEKLREILAAIPKGTKVSDREVSERMAQAGFPMARRTVAKYRAGFLV